MRTIFLLGVVFVAGCGSSSSSVPAPEPAPAPAPEVTPPSGGGGSTSVPPATESGTPESPYEVGAFPYVRTGDTSQSTVVQFSHYAAAPSITEGGPEIYYRVVVPESGTFKAEVAEANGVDVDLHLLTGLTNDDGLAADSIARANTRLTVTNLAAGTYWLVVDSYSSGSAVYAGAYRVAMELDLLDTWQVVSIVPGMTWKKKIYSNYAGGRQTINVLDIDFNSANVEVKPAWTGDGLRPSTTASSGGALAAINGGFFGSGYEALSLIKIDGTVRSYNHLDGVPRRAFGITSAGEPIFATIPAWADWMEAHQALSGHPNLVTDGVIDIQPSGTSSLFMSRHPRTALGLTASNHLLFVTVDGRTSAGVGMTIAELAQHMINLGAQQAINLDGGGSTTMWIQNQSINGIVNYPSDNGQADHYGERMVSDALVVRPAP